MTYVVCHYLIPNSLIHLLIHLGRPMTVHCFGYCLCYCLVTDTHHIHGSAPVYLTVELCQVADVEARQRLRSSSSSSLIVSRTRLLTVGDRAFPIAAARVWNSLPDLVTSAPFCSSKTHLFNIPSPL